MMSDGNHISIHFTYEPNGAEHRAKLSRLEASSKHLLPPPKNLIVSNWTTDNKMSKEHFITLLKKTRHECNPSPSNYGG